MILVDDFVPMEGALGHHSVRRAWQRGERGGGVVPRFCASGSQEGARGWSSAKRECSRSRRLEELCLMCLMHRVCGRAQASTDSGRRAPFALGDDDERVTRGLRIEGLAAASASTFSRGSLSLLDRLPPPPSSARTARTCRSRTMCTVRAARRAPCGRRTRGHGGRRGALSRRLPGWKASAQVEV